MNKRITDPPFEVGNHVKVKKDGYCPCNCPFQGKIGIITGINEKEPKYQVKFNEIIPCEMMNDDEIEDCCFWSLELKRAYTNEEREKNGLERFIVHDK